MQMSIERFREVHKLIWNTVISHAEDVRIRKTSVRFLKMVGVEMARKKGLIDTDEADLLECNNNCLLCASSGSCELCPLATCRGADSLYFRASMGVVDAMIKIRDTVDSKPFTELSIITLYDRGE